MGPALSITGTPGQCGQVAEGPALQPGTCCRPSTLSPWSPLSGSLTEGFVGMWGTHAASRLQKGCQASCVHACPCVWSPNAFQTAEAQSVSELTAPAFLWGSPPTLRLCVRHREHLLLPAHQTQSPRCRPRRGSETLRGKSGWSALQPCLGKVRPGVAPRPGRACGLLAYCPRDPVT